jgi:hypothetical protein
MSSAQQPTATGFERVVTSVWHTVRRVLPPSVADEIGAAAKRVLRSLGLVRSV